MVFESNVEALAAQQPSLETMCYICGEEMISFDPRDSVYGEKGSSDDPTMTTWLECCLRQCHEPCLGRRMSSGCEAQAHNPGEAVRKSWTLQQLERRRQVRQAKAAEDEEKRRQEGTDKMLEDKPLAATATEGWSAKHQRAKHRREVERKEQDEKTGALLGKLNLATRRFNQSHERDQPDL